MTPMKFLIINGPNLNLLGQREPDVYGKNTYADLCQLIQDYAVRHGAQADFYQSNHEGGIIDTIHAAQGVYDAIIINPGAYTHYSYAIHDALKAVTVPAYEVHISDINTREAFRRISVTAPACVGQVCGLGFDGYLRAMDHFLPAQEEEKITFAVIGDPVEHSKSPLIQNAMLGRLGLAPAYGRRHVTLDDLPGFMAVVKKTGYLKGFNATMPHKQALIPLLDEVDEEAALMGAVNTVTVENGKAVGHNTDGRGFLAALKHELDFDPAGKSIIVLGAGGAARAVVLALGRAGAKAVCVSNRNVARAKELAVLCPGVVMVSDQSPAMLQLMAGGTPMLEAWKNGADLVVNCTSLGMKGKEDFADLTFLSSLPQGAAVCDLVYAPRETSLLRAAKELGHPTMGGLGMLIHQAIYALEHFLGRELDHADLARVAQQALEGTI